MNALVGYIREIEIKKKEEILGGIFVGIALTSYLLGIMCLIIFAMKNLY
jgi:hypothetical protein